MNPIHKIINFFKNFFHRRSSNPVKNRKWEKDDLLKINIGCGNLLFPNWVNMDIEPPADIIADVTEGLPFNDKSADFIYNEHFIEHVEFEEAQKLLKEFYRVLNPGGILRIATPDLDYVLEKYSSDWKNQDWLKWPEYQFIKTRGQMINISFRWWGHKYLYNEEDLSNLILNAGFRDIHRFKRNVSDYSELEGLESRLDSKLILEAKK